MNFKLRLRYLLSLVQESAPVSNFINRRCCQIIDQAGLNKKNNVASFSKEIFEITKTKYISSQSLPHKLDKMVFSNDL